MATSLSEGEAEQKHVGLLEIYKNKFKMIPIPLKKVRPFIFKHFTLPSRNDSVYDYNKPKDQASNLVKNEIEKMIKEAAERHSGEDATNLLVDSFNQTFFTLFSEIINITLCVGLLATNHKYLYSDFLMLLKSIGNCNHFI